MTKKKNPAAQALGKASAAKRRKTQPKDFYRKLAQKRWAKERGVQGADTSTSSKSKKKPSKP